MRFFSSFLFCCLMVGLVDQISNGVALIEYKKSGKIEYIGIPIADSHCVPVEGQKVIFSEEEIVQCVELKIHNPSEI